MKDNSGKESTWKKTDEPVNVGVHEAIGEEVIAYVKVIRPL